MSTMRAVVIHHPGGPEALQLESRPIPTPSPPLDTLIRVHAFGLNRSEMFTRQGHSPSVRFPRVLGIEAAGTVVAAPAASGLEEGDVVATAMGGMGRDFDGGYAEYTCVPASQVQNLDKKVVEEVGWEVVGAVPEMVQTAWGALFKSLRLQKGDTLLVRGGTTSVGLAAAGLAKIHGATVIATSRRKDREALVKENGADEMVLDTGDIAGEVERRFGKVDKVLELVGMTTMKDSLQCTREGGIVCLAGIVGGVWTMDNFSMEAIPNAVCLTKYGGGPQEFMETPLTKIFEWVREGRLKIPVGKVFKLEEIVEAHRSMDGNTAGGKIVVLT
ncbi:hypothetical protein MMC08_007713 [Hypocenomyce scalaris]|nr:hypothetical protein [Hypocenomyce scalaris]